METDCAILDFFRRTAYRALCLWQKFYPLCSYFWILPCLLCLAMRGLTNLSHSLCELFTANSEPNYSRVYNVLYFIRVGVLIQIAHRKITGDRRGARGNGKMNKKAAPIASYLSPIASDKGWAMNCGSTKKPQIRLGRQFLFYIDLLPCPLYILQYR